MTNSKINGPEAIQTQPESREAYSLTDGNVPEWMIESIRGYYKNYRDPAEEAFQQEMRLG